MVSIYSLRGFMGKNAENIDFFLFVFSAPKFCLLSHAAAKILDYLHIL